jgi:fructuronate reductase
VSLTPPRLSAATLAGAAGVQHPAYPRADLAPGVLHFGPGAFHRAHQAAYFDALIPADRRWGISAVALNSTDVAAALRPQDGLYTLSILGERPRRRVIGALVELLTRADAQAITARMAAPTTALVTCTVTEKGYHLADHGGLDADHPAVAADLQAPDAPHTLVGWLVHGLAARRAAGAGGLTIISCDNLAANGRRLRRAVLDFAGAARPDLTPWIEDEVRFPSCMVDSITPATDAALRERVQAETGLYDAWPIQRESFSQWVLEDDFAAARPALDTVGVQFVRSAEPFEAAKLRLLNGAHSTLAYLGLLLGHETVHDAIGDAPLARFVERLMREDIAPDLHPAEGLEIGGYIDALLQRFRNPAIRHHLSQIAWDGSQKLRFRLIASARDALAAGRPLERLALPVAAWLRFVAAPRPPWPPLIDPLADRLRHLVERGPDAVLRESGVFPPELLACEAYVAAVLDGYEALRSPDDVRRRL